ncbi:DUF1178 family protein [Sphingomonas sp. PAMC 26605]|uniref:DUF1178 family protein n=1 Tax=Sphingomonas sp. PAMC 26605 TaxID=1112214 RepID=UPI00026CDD75|nr:DUF1178 family protein [Sphingomonas sp. PAMC 26605]
MIVFDLRCSRAHVFEAWFGSSATFEEQRERGLLVCPVCGDTAIGKAVMAPNVGAKGNSRNVVAAKPGSASAVSPTPSPQALKAALQAIAAAQAKALETSRWVGRGFADQARAMHVGETASVPIHGETTLAEAKALVDEGVPVAPLLLPVVPPDALN